MLNLDVVKQVARSLAGVSLGVLLLGVEGAAVPAAPVPSAQDTTITSDEMEIINNGAKTIFTGHVVLDSPPYVLKAKRMVRVEATEIVEAEGDIVGTWVKPTGEKTVAAGDHARYNPKTSTTELWGKPQLTHWDKPGDPEPLIITARRFIAYQDKQLLLAKENVTIIRGTTFRAQSEEAEFDQKAQTLLLHGQKQAALQWVDPRGSGYFLSDRALLSASPRHARLMDRVTGHIVPAHAP